MIRKVHVNLISGLTAVAAGVQEATAIIPVDGDVSLSVLLTAIAVGILGAVKIYESNGDPTDG